jgi:hypothetical protein
MVIRLKVLAEIAIRIILEEEVIKMPGSVHVWIMPPEELEAYKKKYPVKEGVKKRKGYRQKWPHEKAVAARWGNKDK